MNEQRHPHPHVDPRQPRRDAAPRTNPPVFVWKPGADAGPFRLTVARDEGFGDVCLDLAGLADPMHLPTSAFPPGRYYWKWSDSSGESEAFRFDVPDDAVVLEVPPAAEWLRRFPEGHPRIFLRPEDVAGLRESRRGGRAELWRRLRAQADALLDGPHEIDEPPYLPDRLADYEGYYRVWSRILRESRRFVREALTLALAYVAGGGRDHARAACRRMASICRWDPDGSSHIGHNDEAHMSVIWDGPQVCDWVWDAFTEAERRQVCDQFRRRGEINFEHMHDRGMYGVERFDSHAGREIVFLAQIAFVFHEHIPAAAAWLEWLRPVLCGVWPIWAGDDGGWAQGPSYSTAYVGIQTMFATSLKVGAGVDMYRRPFWANHARWRQWCVPPYAQWLGFADNGHPPTGTIGANADLVATIERQTGSSELAGYVAACRQAAGGDAVGPQEYIGGPRDTGASPVPPSLTGVARLARKPCSQDADTGRATRLDEQAVPHDVLRVFPYAGLAAIRTDLDEASRDVALLFRSSPLGSISHSHANNNDFALHVAGEAMLIPSGYYVGYGSSHHVHWVWHTRSHNCVTLSESGQRQRSFDAAGAVEHPFEDDRVAYFRGNGDRSYALAERCRRHVVFLKKPCCFVLIDEFVGVANDSAGLQWNAHAFEPFEVDPAGRRFTVRRGGSTVVGQLLCHTEAFFSLSEGLDPPPMSRDDRSSPDQHHLRFSLSRLGSANLGVVLAPGHAALAAAEVAAERAGQVELARIGEDLVLVDQGAGIDCEGVRSDSVAVMVVGGTRYDITDEGLVRR